MLKTYLNNQRDLIENIMIKYLDELSYPEEIVQGMKYSVLNGGKRIRPILLLMITELLEKDINLSLPSGIAIEFIHSYSLVHDDLPALDNDDYRRGKLTTHKKFGEAEGILIGDALLTHAFNILTEKNSTLLSPEKIVEIIRLTSSYSGVNGMIGGQMVDIQSEGKTIDIETLKYIHKNKTGKLLKLPIEVACIICEVDNDTRKILEEFADLIGLAFQIKDDILDIEGSFESIGKPVGSDIALEKSTYPSLLGLTESKLLLSDIIMQAKNIILSNFPKKNKMLLDLVDYIEKRDK